MAKRVSPSVVEALSACTISGNGLKMPQLDRKVYEETNKVLVMMGGKWNRSAQAHLFPEDPSELVATVLATGEVTDLKQELQFFETPEMVMRMLLSRAELRPGLRVLEPSAGQGALAFPLREHVGGGNVVVCELHPPFERKLLMAGFTTLAADFLGLQPEVVAPFDRVVMNPPFTRQQDVDHVLHGFEFLKPGGILVAVMSPAWQWRDNKKSADFRCWVEQVDAEVEELPEGSFKQSGTGVNTVILKAVKPGG